MLQVTNRDISRYRKYGGTLVKQLKGLHGEVEELYEIQSNHLSSLEENDVNRKQAMPKERRKAYEESYDEMKNIIMAELPALLEKYKALGRTYNKLASRLDKHKVAKAMLEEVKATVLAQVSELKPIASDAITKDYNAFDPQENVFVHKEVTVPTGDQVDTA